MSLIKRICVSEVNDNVDEVIKLAQKYGKVFPIELGMEIGQDDHFDAAEIKYISRNLLDNANNYYTIAMHMNDSICKHIVTDERAIYDLQYITPAGLDRIVLNLKRSMKDRFRPQALWSSVDASRAEFAITHDDETSEMVRDAVRHGMWYGHNVKELKIADATNAKNKTPFWAFKTDFHKDPILSKSFCNEWHGGITPNNAYMALNQLQNNLPRNTDISIGARGGLLSDGKTDPVKVEAYFESIAKWQSDHRQKKQGK